MKTRINLAPAGKGLRWHFIAGHPNSFTPGRLFFFQQSKQSRAEVHAVPGHSYFTKRSDYTNTSFPKSCSMPEGQTSRRSVFSGWEQDRWLGCGLHNPTVRQCALDSPLKASMASKCISCSYPGGKNATVHTLQRSASARKFLPPRLALRRIFSLLARRWYDFGRALGSGGQYKSD